MNGKLIKELSDAKQMKYEVLTKVASYAFDDILDEHHIENIPFEIIPGTTARFRCCVYKEREIIRQRVRLAMNKNPLPDINAENRTLDNNIIQVIPAACEGCPINRFQVTENCQKCMSKNCLHSCAFGAITITGRGAYIDQSKCRECGKCAAACPYHAITDLMRPCKRSCKVDAISIGEDKLAVIDEDKCVNCGACTTGCPFGAISDRSNMLDIISRIKNGEKVIGIPAPSVEGQFGATVTVGKLNTALKQLGFFDAVEVALGGDAVASHEAEELLEVLEKGEKMTTSCCPAFVNLIRKHYPTLVPLMSNTVSPMVATARYLRRKYPDAYIVFIGPCMAKKGEAINREIEGNADTALTFEELLAMFDARGINPEECEEAQKDATSYGRRFSGSGGVAASVIKSVKERGYEGDVKTKLCNGISECKIGLAMLKVGKLPEDLLEGMICENGCIGGPASIAPLQQLKIARMNNIKGADEDSITDNLLAHEFETIPMNRE